MEGDLEHTSSAMWLPRRRLAEAVFAPAERTASLSLPLKQRPIGIMSGRLTSRGIGGR
jgi:hypothetical protein